MSFNQINPMSHFIDILMSNISNSVQVNWDNYMWRHLLH